MTTLNLLIVAGNEDAYETDGNTSFTDTNDRLLVRAHLTDTNRHNSGLRFSNVTIPAGSTINTCTLSLYGKTTGSDDMASDVYFNDVDDAANFDDEADVTNRTPTSASVSWVGDSLGVGYRSPGDLKVACQEVLDRPGWASGQGMCVLVEGKNQASAKNWEGAALEFGSNPAKLDIDYTIPFAPEELGDYPSELPLRVDSFAGAPTHAAVEGTFYWDSTANKLYVNNNGGGGAGAWTAVN
jgi:hypothetical protein